MNVNRLNRNNLILIAILAVQLVAAVILFFPSDEGEAVASGSLLAEFDAQNVQSLTIHDAEDNMVRIAQSDEGTWVLPEHDNFPVDSARVDPLLADLAALQTNRLIAQNESSHNRLKVAASDYERLVEITYDGGETDQLYVGTAGGSNATHMRVNGANQVYLTSGLASWEIPSQVASWIDTLYLSVPQDQMISLTIENANGTFELRKRDETWTLVGLQSGETLDTEQVNTFVRQASNIRMTQPVSQEAQDSFGMDAPLATITIVQREIIEPDVTPTPLAETTPETSIEIDPVGIPGEAEEPVPEMIDTTYTLMVGAPVEEGGDYVVKSSESEFYVQVAPTAVEQFVNLSRADLLVEAEVEVTPEATPAVEITPELTEEPEVEVTLEATPATEVTPEPGE